MAIINGTDFTLYIPQDDTSTQDASTQWYPIGVSTSASISISVDTPDASNKDSSGWSEVIAGQKSWTVSFDGLVENTFLSDADSSFDETVANAPFGWLYYYMTNREKIKIAIGVDGGGYFYGDAFINSLEVSADNESTTTFSGSCQGTSTLSFGNGDTLTKTPASYPN